MRYCTNMQAFGLQNCQPSKVAASNSKVWRGAALAAAARPSSASANPAKQHFIARLGGLVVLQPLGLQARLVYFWKRLININFSS